MKHFRQLLMGLAGVALIASAISISSPPAEAQMEQPNSASATSITVPRLIKFSGTLLDEQGHPLKGPVGVTFALYAQQSGGAALWLETQNVEPDANGNYSVLLGAASADAVPMDLFASGEARWLGVQAERQLEQPRVLLVSVPYALKAGDAQTLGGLPANAFALAGTPSASASSSSSTTNIVTAAQPAGAATIGGTGTTDFIPLWSSSATLGNSIMFQAPTNSIGIGTTAPAAKLDVNGGATIRGQLSLPFIGTATSTLGSNSQPFDLLASAFNSATHAAVPQNFRWQAEPLGNNTASPSGKLNLLFGFGTATPVETGLSVSNKGIITFAPGQTMPAVTGNETVNGNLTATGSISAAAGTLSGNNSTILSVTQSSPGGLGLVANVVGGQALRGSATSTTAFTSGVFGEAASPNGFGVQGFNISGVGVLGFGSVGVKGWSTSPGGLAGFFQAANGASLLLGRNGTTTVFSVDSSGNLFGASSLTTGGSIVANGIVEAGSGAVFTGLTQVKGNSAFTNIGDPGCGPGFGGIGFALFSGCNNYSMIGDGTNTYINRPAGGTLYFRENNGTQMSMAPGGDLSLGGNANQGRSSGGWIKAMAVIDETISPVGPSQIVRCYNSQISGAASSTPPCGFNMTFGDVGGHVIDFGFQITDRFILATPVFTLASSNTGGVVLNLQFDNTLVRSSSQVLIDTFYNGSGDFTDTTVYILVF